MAKFNVAVNHQFSREDVLTRLKGFSNQLRQEVRAEVSDIQEHWDDHGNLNFSFKAMGFKVSGQMVASDSDVKVSGDLPFAALPFRGVIESQVAEKIQQAIA